MTALDYILEGLEAELALERELGVRSIEIDRSLLAPPERRKTAVVAPPAPPPEFAPQPAPSAPPATAARPVASVPAKPALSADGFFDFVFLHDRPLTGAGADMIAKITSAMLHTPDTAPVVADPPRPKAQIYVVLGDRALKKWFPGLRAGPGMWISGNEGEEALVTYSPNYFLRFAEVTPAVQKIKGEMWKSLKGVMQRLALKRR